MKKPGSGLFQLFIAGGILIIFSCTPESCLEETNSFLKASFYKNETGKFQAPDSVTMFGEGRDTILIYNKEQNVQPANFPLNAETGSCTFIVRINGVSDTISFFYSTYPAFISKECGFTFNHILESHSVTNNIIDNIIIRNRNITTSNEENIRIFY